MTTVAPEQIRAGHRIYTSWTLRCYDFIVLRLSNPLVWRCPTSILLRHYQAHLTDNHLDIGVGTGFFPAHCQFPSSRPRLALMDLNTHCLSHTARRLNRFHPEIHRVNILDPPPLVLRKFDSVALNYLLHCLPGGPSGKRRALQNAARWLNPGGVLFGSTLLGADAAANLSARWLMRFYNSKGIFSNEQDTADSLSRILNESFLEAEVQTRGCVALFRSRTPCW